MLFLFGCSTCVNACGWISVAPVFLLVEDVSINGYSKFLDKVITYIIILLALRCVSIDGEYDVILIYGALPTNELSLRLHC